jgi:nitrogen fixation NifU-like protein
VQWSGTGCAISQAAMSMLSEELAGMKTSDLEKMKTEHIYELLGVPVGPRRFKCALLCLHTLKNALRVHAGNEPQGWLETVALDND